MWGGVCVLYSQKSADNLNSSSGQKVSTTNPSEKLGSFLTSLDSSKKWWTNKNSIQYDGIIDLVRIIQGQEESEEQIRRISPLANTNFNILDKYKLLEEKCTQYIESHNYSIGLPRFTSTGRERLEKVKEILEFARGRQKEFLNKEDSLISEFTKMVLDAGDSKKDSPALHFIHLAEARESTEDSPEGGVRRKWEYPTSSAQFARMYEIVRALKFRDQAPIAIKNMYKGLLLGEKYGRNQYLEPTQEDKDSQQEAIFKFHDLAVESSIELMNMVGIYTPLEYWLTDLPVRIQSYIKKAQPLGEALNSIEKVHKVGERAEREKKVLAFVNCAFTIAGILNSEEIYLKNLNNDDVIDMFKLGVKEYTDMYEKNLEDIKRYPEFKKLRHYPSAGMESRNKNLPSLEKFLQDD